MAKIDISWSKLLPFKTAKIEELEDLSGVYRLSKKAEDGKYYVFFVGSSDNIKNKLLSYIIQKNSNDSLIKFLSQGGDFSFRYAKVEDKSIREAIEKQMFKHYIPEFNREEPKSSLDIEANLN